MNHSATYSPDDNKLRLYPACRLDAETYARMKAAGFKWAPKQELFVAPMWTPIRADLLVELCGEIDDEDTSLVERAEQRADRFEDFSEKRTDDARRAQKAVAQIADAIPLGQPIMVGHHSERSARRDAKRITDGMRQAVRMWETAEYWQSRAAGALAAAKYKERPDVRARRIKTIEADMRKMQRDHDSAAANLKAWNTEGLTHEQALNIAGFSHLSGRFPLATYPRELPASQYEGDMSFWSALNDGIITAEQAGELAGPAHRRTMAWAARWIEHYTLRIGYERAMLDEQGGTVAEKTGPEKGGAVRCWAAPRGGWAWIKKVNKVSVTIEDNWGNGGGNFTRTIPFDKLTAIMTAADVAQARGEERLTELDDGTGFVLLKPAPTKDNAPTADVVDQQPNGKAASRDENTDAAAIDALREQLRHGVQVVVAPLLYPTPVALAEKMVDLAGIEHGMRLLDPSAGTGVLLDAARRMRGAVTTAVELDCQLAARLRLSFDDVRQADFLTCGQELGGFDRVLMNPPFNGGADIAHIRHACSMLKPGGVLVAICADGPRQNAQLRPLAEDSGGSWESLPAGSFLHAGTSVNTALLVIRAA